MKSDLLGPGGFFYCVLNLGSLLNCKHVIKAVKWVNQCVWFYHYRCALFIYNLTEIYTQGSNYIPVYILIRKFYSSKVY